MKIIVIGLFLIILFGCKQASVQFMGEIENNGRAIVLKLCCVVPGVENVCS